jgi:hypothetical protein
MAHMACRGIVNSWNVVRGEICCLWYIGWDIKSLRRVICSMRFQAMLCMASQDQP